MQHVFGCLTRPVPSLYQLSIQQAVFGCLTRPVRSLYVHELYMQQVVCGLTRRVFLLYVIHLIDLLMECGFVSSLRSKSAG